MRKRIKTLVVRCSEKDWKPFDEAAQKTDSFRDFKMLGKVTNLPELLFLINPHKFERFTEYTRLDPSILDSKTDSLFHASVICREFKLYVYHVEEIILQQGTVYTVYKSILFGTILLSSTST